MQPGEERTYLRFDRLVARPAPSRWNLISFFRLASLCVTGVLLASVALLSSPLRAHSWFSKEPDRRKVVYIIRHGEKAFDPDNRPAFDYACLSEKGWARAYNLRSVFGPRPQPPFQTPDALFAGNYANSIDCRDENGWYRTEATIGPLAASGPSSLGLPVDNRSGFGPGACAAPADECPHVEPSEGGTAHGFGVCCNAAAAAAIRTKLHEPSVATVLVCWEHTNIPVLASALGVPRHLLEGGWPDSDYDRVYALRFTSTGQWLHIDTGLSQGFTDRDERWLGPSRGCGAVAPARLGRRGIASSETESEASVVVNDT